MGVSIGERPCPAPTGCPQPTRSPLKAHSSPLKPILGSVAAQATQPTGPELGLRCVAFSASTTFFQLQQLGYDIGQEAFEIREVFDDEDPWLPILHLFGNLVLNKKCTLEPQLDLTASISVTQHTTQHNTTQQYSQARPDHTCS